MERYEVHWANVTLGEMPKDRRIKEFWNNNALSRKWLRKSLIAMVAGVLLNVSSCLYRVNYEPPKIALDETRAAQGLEYFKGKTEDEQTRETMGLLERDLKQMRENPEFIVHENKLRNINNFYSLGNLGFLAAVIFGFTSLSQSKKYARVALRAYNENPELIDKYMKARALGTVGDPES